MIYAYAAKGIAIPNHIAEEVKQYARNHGLPLTALLQDQAIQTMKWQERNLLGLLGQMQSGDSLIVYEISDIGCSMKNVAEFLAEAVNKGLMIHFIKYEKIFYGEKFLPADELIDLFRHFECDFIAHAAVGKQLRRFNKKIKAA